jgi:hypothetical protein
MTLPTFLSAIVEALRNAGATEEQRGISKFPTAPERPVTQVCGWPGARTRAWRPRNEMRDEISPPQAPRDEIRDEIPAAHAPSDEMRDKTPSHRRTKSPSIRWRGRFGVLGARADRDA